MPLAGCHVVPPSVETSTPATTPPPVSVAVPEIVIGEPLARFDAGCRRGDRRRGRRRVGRCRRADEAGLQRRRLGAHVGEEVDRRLLHVRVDRAAGGRVVETPRPLHGAGAEHERAARGLVERQVMGRGLVERRLGSVVGEDLGARGRRRRQVEEPGGSEPVVGLGVPLVAERPETCSERCRLPRRERRDRRVPPHAQVRVLRGHLDVGRARVHEEELTGQRVLGPAAVTGRAEPRVAPRAGPRDRDRSARRSACPCTRRGRGWPRPTSRLPSASSRTPRCR